MTAGVPLQTMYFRYFLSPCHLQGTQSSRWKNSNATSVLMHHRDLAEIREVGSTNVVDFRFSSSGRMACTTSHSYWLRISHILLWMRAEVSFRRDWTTWVSFFQWEGSLVDKSQVNREKIAPLHI